MWGAIPRLGNIETVAGLQRLSRVHYIAPYGETDGGGICKRADPTMGYSVVSRTHGRNATARGYLVGPPDDLEKYQRKEEMRNDCPPIVQINRISGKNGIVSVEIRRSLHSRIGLAQAPLASLRASRTRTPPR